MKFKHNIKQPLPCPYCNKSMQILGQSSYVINMKCSNHQSKLDPNGDPNLELYFIFNIDNSWHKNSMCNSQHIKDIYLSSVNYNIKNVKLITFFKDNGKSCISEYKYEYEWKINHDIKMPNYWPMDKSLEHIIARIKTFKLFY